MSLNEPEDIPGIDPNNFEPGEDRSYPNLKSIIGLFFILLFYMLIGGIFAGFLFISLKTTDFNSPTVKSFVNLLLYTLSFLLTIRYAIKAGRKLEGTTFKISFNKIPFWITPVLIISTIALFVGLERISALLPMPVSVQKFFEKLFAKDAFSIVTMIVAAPILEEVLCRGIILRGLLKNNSPGKAILISAFFFAAMHLNPWQALPAFFGGLFIGWVYYKMQSVIPGIIIHATVNGTAALFLFFPKHQQDLLSLVGMPYYIILCVCATLTFTIGCMIINKKLPHISN